MCIFCSVFCFFFRRGGGHVHVHKRILLLFGYVADALALTRAIEAEAVTVLANVSGPRWPENVQTGAQAAEHAAAGHVVGVGRSAVNAPFLGTVGRLAHADERVLLASVDLACLRDARATYRIRTDLARAQG